MFVSAILSCCMGSMFYFHKVKKKQSFFLRIINAFTRISLNHYTKQTRNYTIIETDWLSQLTDRCTAIDCFPTLASDRTLALVDRWEKIPGNWNRTCLLTVYDTSHDVLDVYCTHANRKREKHTRRFVKRAKRQHCNVVTFWLHAAAISRRHVARETEEWGKSARHTKRKIKT